MPQVQICSRCNHVVDVEEENYVILRDDQTEMHSECYEQQVTEEEVAIAAKA